MGGGTDDATPPRTNFCEMMESIELQVELQKKINPGERTLMGQPPSRHWMHYVRPNMFDLTRPIPPEWALPEPHERIHLLTEWPQLVISPAKTALIIIDMQNFFLSPALGREVDGAGNKARKKLLENAIPAANAAGIQVIWLNDIEQMPASVLCGFGAPRYRTRHEHHRDEAMGRPRGLYRGLGNELGKVTLEDGSVVEGGRMLMRDYWNSDLPPDLDSSFEEGLEKEPAHVWMHKNRMDGLWNSELPLVRFLQERGICTLLFAGVNTDQCVGGTLQSAYSQGYDCIMLSDACGTSSPSFAKECIEYNIRRSWGFVSDSLHFKKGVEKMLEAKQAKQLQEQ